MKTYQSLLTASLLMALAVAAGCLDTSDVVDNGKGVTGVDINPDKDTLTKGTKLQLQAMVQYADGTSKDVTEHSDTVWSTSDPGIASVSADGMVTAVSEGAVDISADYKGEKGDEHFVVTP